MTKLSKKSQGFDSRPVANWTDVRGATCSFISPGWYELTGQRRGHALGAGWLEAIHPNDRPKVERRFVSAFKRRIPVSVDYRLRDVDGRFRLVTDSGVPRLDRNGRFLDFEGSVVEHLGSPDKDAPSLATDPFVQALFAQTTAGVIVVRPGGHFVRVNDRFCDIAGRTRAELASLRICDIAHPGDKSRTERYFDGAMTGGLAAEFDQRYVRPDGLTVWVHNIVFGVAGPDGKAGLGGMIVSDISDRQRVDFERHMRQFPAEATGVDISGDADSLLSRLLRDRNRRPG